MSLPFDGVPFACTAQWLGFSAISGTLDCTPEDGPPVISSKTPNESYLAIQKLFAKIYSVTRFSTAEPLNYDTLQGAGGQNPNGLQNFDRSGEFIVDENNNPLLPPQIYSLNPYRCGDSSSGGCTAGEANNFSINRHNATMTNYDGKDPVADEDLDYSGNSDPLIKTGSYSVTAEFFAWADDNRMPIRKVSIDWRDGSDPFSATGFYKNRKPFCLDHDDPQITFRSSVGGSTVLGLCGTDSTHLTGLTCKTDRDCLVVPPGANASTVATTCFGSDTHPSTLYTVARFGNASRACDSGRKFLFQHDYTCSRNILVDNAGNLLDPATHPWAHTIAELGNSASPYYDQDAYDRLTGPTYGRLAATTPVCIFKPRVQVVDNWGWCNGVESDGVTPMASGYFSDSINAFGTTIDICLNNFYIASTPYKGQIIVLPSN
jgi:hypothetical protein